MARSALPTRADAGEVAVEIGTHEPVEGGRSGFTGGDGVDGLDTAAGTRADFALAPLSTLFLEGETLGAFVVAFDPSADRFFAAAFGAEALDVVVALALRRLAAEPVTEVFVFKAVLAEERRGRIE